jgi:hypothetical protein
MFMFIRNSIQPDKAIIAIHMANEHIIAIHMANEYNIAIHMANEYIIAIQVLIFSLLRETSSYF